MRMQKCPQCGADNSIKRTTCYQCGREFTSHVVARSSGAKSSPKPAANSRWEAIEPVKRPTAARPLSGAISSPVVRAPAPTSAAPEAESQPRPRRHPFVAPRSSIKHVRQMAMFYRELHSLIKAGITVATACRELEFRVPPRFRSLARDMGAAAEGGKPISSVLEDYRELIYPWHLGVFRAAESAGSLPEAMDQIAAAYELEWQTRAEIGWRVFLYTFIGLPMVLCVIPSILMMNQPYPKDGWTIQYSIQLVRHFFLTVSLPIGAGLLVLFITWRLISGTAWCQALQHRAVLLIPIVGGVSKIGALGRYLSTLAMLLKAGVPLSDSVEEAAMAAGNAGLTPRLLQVAPKVQAGVPLAQALQETRVFDGDTLRLAGTGEMTGSLPEMLGRAAQYCREKYDGKRRVLMKVAGVAITVAFGIVVGILVIWTALSYFDAMFRGLEWMEQG